MGNTESVVVQKRLARFRPDERPLIEAVFDRLHAGARETQGPAAGRVLTLPMLQSTVGALLSESLLRRLFGSMCSISSGSPAASSPGVSRQQLLIFLADTLRGTAEERAPLVLAMTLPGAAHVSAQQVSECLQDLISGVLRLMATRGRLQGWEPSRMSPESRGVQLLAEQMTSELKASDSGGCDVSCLEDWIFRVPQVSLYLEMLVAESLGVALSGRAEPNLLPSCQGTAWKDLRSLLDLPTIVFLAPLLPERLSAPWRLVFSTQLHGESFTRLVAALTGHGPNLLVIKDTKGHVFGGFASCSWEVKPQFQGDSRCFLFTIVPRLRVFTATSYNQHFMYLNQNQQTMPNGLGMGGQHHYFGLWLDSDFGRGHSRARPKCTTYGSPQLSADEDFAVDCVEVWAVGKLPEPEEDDEVKGKKSILDADPEAEALLEMTGRSLQSQGLREPEEEP
ncbi:MTOR-associated protein MEAK7 isoform X1 [Synchiropus splendidus]|uniref:MTOR-associated protein MEAK7 isoform X1 n=2 Tax=Synchiropus splendidus TaxID=270530 RepID=UPI00237E16DA|nr:MTOR-associated protein MEAK7 isoform X1 [Synchiropus splendidus]XP_053742097.1 MTOR-associated protein MEAK7 isoform X1 [Synchiropus splendidus]XP_053742098.1 MTOR-associated protein MEAK7 isoform X1 [Synchiropus splendidus]